MRSRGYRDIALSLAVTVALSATPTWSVVAHADEAPVTVTLKNGAVYHGELVEKVPGDHVTIKLATGEVKRFEDADLSPAPAPATAQPAATSPAGPVTRVHLEGEGLVLERSLGSATGSFSVGGRVGVAAMESWTPVCKAPCDESVPRLYSYRVTARGHMPTGTFELSDADANIRAVLGSRVEKAFGVGCLYTGVAGAVLGGVLFFGVSGDDQVWAGAGFLAGAALIAVGIGLFVDAGSSVSVNGREVASLSVPLGAGLALTPTGLAF